MSLRLDQIATSGRRHVADHGWNGLSLRAVADGLGVTPMALYRYVPDATGLKAMVLESIVADVMPNSLVGSLEAELRSWARQVRDVLIRYEGVGSYLLSTWFESPTMLGIIDDLLGLALKTGLDEFEAVATVNAVFMYALMRAHAETVVRTSGTVKRELRVAAAVRPLPHLTALSRHYRTAEFDLHFDYGLNALLDGIVRRVREAS